MFEVKNRAFLKTVFVRMSGFMTGDEMRDFSAQLKAASDSYQGDHHMTLADMRGFKPCDDQAAAILQDAIGHQRAAGCVVCAHVSDQTIARLQMLRLTSQINPDDEVTIDCVSVDEARAVLQQKRLGLFANEVDGPEP